MKSMRKYLTHIIRLVLFLFVFSINAVAQTAIIKIVSVPYPDFNGYEKFDSIQFQFNNVRFNGSDTTTKIILLNKSFDQCQAIINKDTFTFFTKFRPNQTYIIRQGCCCAAFTLAPQKEGERGNVTFKNTTKRDLILSVCEHSGNDTVKTNKTQTCWADESMMCYFKPCNIVLAETAFGDDKYNYKNDKRNYDELWKEQNSYIIANVWYHFLHGEKIEILLDEKNKRIKLKHIGNLSQKEIEKR